MKGDVLYDGVHAGVIEQTDTGFRFIYDQTYLASKGEPISATMPVSIVLYESSTMFPFFDGLIPEGWLLDIATEHWKIKATDRMRLLLTVCEDCIGAVSVINKQKDE
jgi:serine/threonine-protein kinase HipA